MNDTEERINKMLKKSEVILNAGKLKPMTKEEWFDGLSTEEKAEWLTEFAIRFIPCELTVPSKKIKTYKNNIMEWLKQPHKE